MVDNTEVGIFLGIKYEPLSDPPPSLKYVGGAPGAHPHCPAMLNEFLFPNILLNLKFVSRKTTFSFSDRYSHSRAEKTGNSTLLAKQLGVESYNRKMY